MCAIAGVLAPGRANPLAVQAMMDVQAHRGPDDSGLWRSADGQCVLGHRRLAILDLSQDGRQPMVANERGLAIVYNGEIYNYIELRERLVALGHSFRTGTDTEVLLRAYAEWGSRCLDELNGMFAFAIWDEREKSLFCARDRFGEKPFVYAWAGGAFVFASEVKALALVAGVDLAIDDDILRSFIDRGISQLAARERTLLAGVRQLLPAKTLEVELRGSVLRARQRTYWTAPLERHGYGQDDPGRAAKELLDLLSDSVGLRLRSDVPVGSCLSGGLDSSTVVSLIRRRDPGRTLDTFTGRFPDSPLDEGRWARMVAEASGARAHDVVVSPERFVREASALYWHADFPISALSQFAQWCVFRLARSSGVIVLLDGQGSDEQLGGYPGDIPRAFLRQLVDERRPGAWLRERLAAARTHPASFSLAIGSAPVSRARLLLRRLRGRPGRMLRSLLAPEWEKSSRSSAPDPPTAMEGGALSQVLWRLSFRTMLSSLLRYGDRLSMAHGLEVRLPFCDHRIAEWAFQLSPDLLVGDGQAKRVLRLAIRGLVPDPIVDRPKQCFLAPQADWLAHRLEGFIADLAEGSNGLDGRLDLDRVRRLSHAPPKVRPALWPAVNLLAWERFALDRMRAQQREPATVDSPVPLADLATGCDARPNVSS